jgi:hypothetical protein
MISAAMALAAVGTAGSERSEYALDSRIMRALALAVGMLAFLRPAAARHPRRLQPAQNHRYGRDLLFARIADLGFRRGYLSDKAFDPGRRRLHRNYGAALAIYQLERGRVVVQLP